MSGLVLERGTDRPVVMARISLLGAGDSVMAQTLSDASGGFSLSSQEAGAFLLHTKALGYRESRAGIFELGPGGEMTLQIRLVPEPLEIEGLTVSREVALPKLVASGFLERFVGGLGHFLTPADLERGTGRLLIDRLGKLPGVRVVHGTVSLFNRARPCTPPIYLDGALALVQGDVEMLVGLEDVEAVEVYQGVTETPPQFGGMHSEVCGAIVIWTKRRD